MSTSDDLALKFYTACFDGELSDVKEILQNEENRDLDINTVSELRNPHSTSTCVSRATCGDATALSRSSPP